jgi:coproporphyrinogen III oxidase-like Fe-S oxidoreductase
MRRLMEGDAQAFPLVDDGEYSIEVDPRKVDAARCAACSANSASTA